MSRLIPPPRVHRHRYHGVLAPNARLRERVIARACHGDEGPTDTATHPPGGITMLMSPAVREYRYQR